MKVVINALQYKQNSSGIGVMLRELFGQYTNITSRCCQVIVPNDGVGFPAASSAEIICLPWAHSQNLRRMLFQTIILGRKYCENSILLTTDSKIPFFVPRNCVVISVITDLAVYRLRETYQLSRVLWWRLQYKYVCRRANQFVAISEFTKQEMIEILHIPPEKIEIIPCACACAFHRKADQKGLAGLRRSYDLPEQYILFVGNFNPRKNLERLIKAFDLAKDRGGISHQLVIAGEQGWKFDKHAVLKDVRHKEDIRFIGFVPDSDMSMLYSAADLFAFPTLYEGFGIPVIEAQRCGTPVLTSCCSALPEVGGNAAIYVNPYDVEDIARGMLQVLQDLALSKKLSVEGRKNAERFSWQESACKLDKLVERTAKRMSD